MFRQIEFYSNPLKKDRYHIDEIRKKKVGSYHGMSGLLSDIRDSIGKSQLLTDIEPFQANDLVEPATNSHASPDPDSFLGEKGLSWREKRRMRKAGEKAENSPAPSAVTNSIKKKENIINHKKERSKFTIYDYSDIQLEQLENELNELINQDNFYSEVKPIDAELEYSEKAPLDKRVFLIIALMILLIIITFFYIKYIIF